MIALTAGTLSVRYTKFQDRLSHTIGIEIDDSYCAILESIEGSEEDPWPASPPMQQMVEECFTPGANPVLLGVGLSGNGHWSTAIETIDFKRLKFDIACKNSKSAAAFGSQYRALTHFQLSVQPTSNCVVFDLSEFGNSLISPRIELRVSIGQLETLERDRTIRVLPISKPGEIRTHRWCYELGIF